MERDGEAIRRLIAEVQPLLPESKQKNACDILEAAVEREPGDLVRYRALAWAYLQDSKTGLALQTVHRAFAAGADDDWTHRMLGIVHARDGKLDLAIQAGQNALVRAPGKREILRDLLNWQLDAGRWDDLRETLAQLEQVAPDWSATLVSQAALAVHDREWEACERLSRQALRLDSRCYGAWINLGSALFSQGKNWRALGCYVRGYFLGDGSASGMAGMTQALTRLPVIALGVNLLIAWGLFALGWRLAPEGVRLVVAGLLGGGIAGAALIGFLLYRPPREPEQSFSRFGWIVTALGSYALTLCLLLISVAWGFVSAFGVFGRALLALFALSYLIGGMTLLYQSWLGCVVLAGLVGWIASLFTRD
jgi:hypothetical protein